MIRRILANVLRPLWEFTVRHVPIDDPWERLATQPKLHMYGSGARLDFASYLKGETLVVVTSLEEVQDWLLGCRHEYDDVLFGESDFWQHPSTFERLRAGDCEDYAVWAWRKLVELGEDVDLVAGWCVREGELDGRHAWLLLRRDGIELLFEPVAQDQKDMVRPLADVRDSYVPQFGVDRHAKRFAFSGYTWRAKAACQPSVRAPLCTTVVGAVGRLDGNPHIFAWHAAKDKAPSHHWRRLRGRTVRSPPRVSVDIRDRRRHAMGQGGA